MTNPARFWSREDLITRASLRRKPRHKSRWQKRRPARHRGLTLRGYDKILSDSCVCMWNRSTAVPNVQDNTIAGPADLCFLASRMGGTYKPGFRVDDSALFFFRREDTLTLELAFVHPKTNQWPNSQSSSQNSCPFVETFCLKPHEANRQWAKKPKILC